MEAYKSINYNLARIEVAEGREDSALALLNNCGCAFGPCDQVDSLKVTLLINKYGKEMVKGKFEQELAQYSSGNMPDLHQPYCFDLQFPKESVLLSLDRTSNPERRMAVVNYYRESKDQEKLKWFDALVELQPFHVLLK